MSKRLAMAVMVLCALMAARPAHAAEEPDNVAAVVKQAADECRSLGGQPNADAVLSVDDLNGDGGEDWIVDFSKFHCAGSPNPFCGSAGCSLQIFLWSSGSQWKSVFDDVVQRYRLTRVQQRRAIELTMGGEACGRAGTVTCRRVLLFGRNSLVPAR